MSYESAMMRLLKDAEERVRAKWKDYHERFPLILDAGFADDAWVDGEPPDFSPFCLQSWEELDGDVRAKLVFMELTRPVNE